MKAIFTLGLLLFLNATLVAQTTQNNDKVNITQMDVVLVSSLPTSIGTQKVDSEETQSIARLYRYSNSRVKKELSFKTKKDRPKLA